MAKRNLNFEETVVELGRLKNDKPLVRKIVEKIVGTGKINGKALNIVKEEKHKKETRNE